MNRYKKSLGQHFIKDKNLLIKIVNFASLQSQDIVLEIGSGEGDLTEVIAQKAKKVYSIEIDNALIPHLLKRFENYNNVEIIHGDILNIDIKKIEPNKKLKLIANLPYNISLPILFKLLDCREIFSLLIIMLQKEVGERILASPNTKSYGILSVLMQAYFNIKKEMKVSPHIFTPSPKVDSIVLKLEPYKEPKYFIQDYELFKKIVKSAFSHRRKMIKNSILSSNSLELDSSRLDILLKNSKIDPKRRAETLTLEEFIKLEENYINISSI